jgi:hypothetical protein
MVSPDLQKKVATSCWEFYYGLLGKYVNQKGHALVLHNYITQDGYKLGAWVNSQRVAYRNGKLQLEYQKKLEQLPKWTWNPSETAWQKGFQYLCEHVKRKGYPIVPISYFTEDGYNLGFWVANQRKTYQKGKLLPGRQKLLEQLPGWIWKSRTEDHHKFKLWNEWYERLKKYVELNGSSKLSHNYHTKKDEYNFGIGTWVSTQRAAFRKGNLSIERQKLLEQIPGWEWNSEKIKTRRLDSNKWNKGFQHIQEYAQLTGHTRVSQQYVTSDGYNLGIWVAAQRTAYRKRNILAERKKILEQLPGWEWRVRKAKTRLLNSNQRNDKKVKIRWSEGLKHLLKYLKLEGHTLVPLKYVTKRGFELGRWVSRQRTLYKLGKLTIKQQKTLEMLPTWVWDANKNRWFKGFKYLCEYVKHKGDALVPRRYIEKDGYKLGHWVMSQRELYKQKRLSGKRRQLLEKLPVWMWRPRKESHQILSGNWVKSLGLLREYIEHEGHASAPSTYVTEDGYKLGTWVRDQRYKYNKGQLSKEKQKALEQLPGWIWALERSGATWSDALTYLHEYVNREGHASVPFKYIMKDGYNLGTWVALQRRAYKRGKLSAERQKALEQLPGWIWVIRKRGTWTKGFEYLRKYVESGGRTFVPQRYITEDGYNLGKWINCQRRLYKRGKLSAERQKALEQLKGWVWDSLEQKWLESFKHLRKYTVSKGHASVPLNYVAKDGYKLGKWVSSQRQLYKQRKLSAERQKALEQLKGWVWGNTHEKLWTKGFEHLRKYAESEGHTSVPFNYVAEDGYKLGQWVSMQRHFYKQGKLSTERQEALEQLPGGVWMKKRNSAKSG